MDPTRSTLLVRLADPEDQEAWRIFDRLYRPMLVGFSRTRGLEQADAEDVAQHCTAAVLKHIAQFQHRHAGSFKGWLRSIAENRIRDLARARGAGRREEQADTGIWSRQADDAENPEQSWERHWLREHLRYCLEQIRPDIAESTFLAFHQNVLEERPAKEVAEALGMTANQVYVAKFRVLERIRNMMLELTGPDGAGTVP